MQESLEELLGKPTCPNPVNTVIVDNKDIYGFDLKLQAQVEHFAQTGEINQTLQDAIGRGTVSISTSPVSFNQEQRSEDVASEWVEKNASYWIYDNLDNDLYNLIYELNIRIINPKLYAQAEYFVSTGRVFETLQNALDNGVNITHIVNDDNILILLNNSNLINNQDNVDLHFADGQDAVLQSNDIKYKFVGTDSGFSNLKDISSEQTVEQNTDKIFDYSLEKSLFTMFEGLVTYSTLEFQI